MTTILMQDVPEECLATGAKISFVLNSIANAPSLIPSKPMAVMWTSEVYSTVAESEAEGATVTNTVLGSLMNLVLDQASEAFGVPGTRTKYEIRFTPTNPIPEHGWIKLVYPRTIDVGSATDLLKSLLVVTTQAYNGADDSAAMSAASGNTGAPLGGKYFTLSTKARTIWMYGFFQEGEFTSEMTIAFDATNPTNNFLAPKESPTDTVEQQEYWSSFHLSTYTFDLETDNAGRPYDSSFEALVQDQVKKQLEIQAGLSSGPEPTPFSPTGVDEVVGNDLRPRLLCNAPCLTCLESNPDYCLACWGRGTYKDSEGTIENDLLFLMSRDGKATCKASCDDGYTTNGNIQPAEKDGVARDPKEAFYICESCEVSCGTCRGQGVPPIKAGEEPPKPPPTDLATLIGKPGDKDKCLTCSATFPFYVPAEEKCYVACQTGFYEKLTAPHPELSECAKCKSPCRTCRKCTDGSENCGCTDTAGKRKPGCVDEEPSASFCTSCDQTAYFPPEIADLEDIDAAIIAQARMVDDKASTLTDE